MDHHWRSVVDTAALPVKKSHASRLSLQNGLLEASRNTHQCHPQATQSNTCVSSCTSLFHLDIWETFPATVNMHLTYLPLRFHKKHRKQQTQKKKTNNTRKPEKKKGQHVRQKKCRAVFLLSSVRWSCVASYSFGWCCFSSRSFGRCCFSSSFLLVSFGFCCLTCFLSSV